MSSGVTCCGSTSEINGRLASAASKPNSVRLIVCISDRRTAIPNITRIDVVAVRMIGSRASNSSMVIV